MLWPFAWAMGKAQRCSGCGESREARSALLQRPPRAVSAYPSEGRQQLLVPHRLRGAHGRALGAGGRGGAVQTPPTLPPWPSAACHSSGRWDIVSLRDPPSSQPCAAWAGRNCPRAAKDRPHGAHTVRHAGAQGTKHWAGRMLLHSPANSCQTTNAGSFSPKSPFRKAGLAVALQDS